MNIDEMASYCKRRGLVFPTAEIYGNYSGFYDYGPVGVEILRNLKNEWWKTFVQSREDVVGIDGSIITNPKVWIASGHVNSFTDPLVECNKCHKRFRADHVIEDTISKSVDGMNLKQLSEVISKNNIKCPECRGALGEVKTFNQMFTTSVGPVSSDVAYLRPETAQSIFVNFKPVIDTTRLKPTFGIAQIGKAFRNEISPRNFLFRQREFEQMEIEYFALKSQLNDCPYFDEIKNEKINVLTEDLQKKEISKAKLMSINDCVKEKVFTTKWHAYWTFTAYDWLVSLGIRKEKLRIRQHVKTELSHYSAGTVDIEYEFPMGFKEIQGIADRTNFDLTQHQENSKQNLEYFNPDDNSKELLSVVAEPSIGVDRLFLTLIFDNLVEEKDRIVLKIKPNLAPYKVGIFPLVKKKLSEKSREIFKELSKDFNCFYDDSGSIGRRYRRQDEIGTPYCITIDFDTLDNDTVTLRDRDSMKQERVKISELKKIINKKLE